jgi:amino acid transporter
VFWCIAINLIGLGSYAAIAGVFNVCAIALDWSYCIPIFCKIVFGKFKPGPWHMGRYGIFVNAWACLWTLFVSIIFILPTVRPVTALTMNYAVAFLGLILLAALIWWYAGGRKYYTGPIVEAVVLEESFDARDSSSQENEKNVLKGN